MFRPGLQKFLSARILAILVCALIMTACAPPNPASNANQALDDVNYYLSIGDCGDALSELTPIYNSASTNNAVRMAMASVYGCFSGFNFFNFISKATSVNISSNSFLFEFMAQEFPSTTAPTDKVVESAGYGIDALMSVLNPGQVLISTDLINTTGDNEGSTLYTDRTQDSNDYLFFLSMAAMGGEENRLGASSTTGAPSAAGEPTWTTASASGMSTNGCVFASSLVNFADSIASISTDCSATAPAATDVLAYVAYALNCLVSVGTNKTVTSFPQLIYDACNYGCNNTVPVNDLGEDEGTVLNSFGGWTASGCTSTAGACALCPMLLRDRTQCEGVTSDQVSCAAAGLINFINNSAIGWR